MVLIALGRSCLMHHLLRRNGDDDDDDADDDVDDDVRVSDHQSAVTTPKKSLEGHGQVWT